MTAPTYYRSLDHLAATPEFQAQAAEEFPGFVNVYDARGEAELRDDNPGWAIVSRRKFLALSSTTLAMAALAGCRRPEIPILPYAAVPDEQTGHIVHGQPTFYATSIPRPGGALPVLVESHDGRPTKIEGHPQHPCSRGSTDAFAQASIFDLYSPDRVMSEKYPGVMQGRSARKWDDYDRFARTLTEQLTKDKGRGLAILTEQTPFPALRLLRQEMAAKWPETAWYSYEACDLSEILHGTDIAFGEKLLPRYHFERAERILALDSDFLGHESDHVFYARNFATKRHDERSMNRLYVVESTYTITGTMADHRYRLAASQIGFYLIALAEELKTKHAAALPSATALPALPNASAFERKWVQAVAHDLAANAGKSLVVVGPRQPAWVHALAHAVNVALGNYAAGMAEFRPAPPEMLDPSLPQLVEAIRQGQVNTLIIIGGNPVLNAPADLRFAEELTKVRTTIRLGLYYDQTSERCSWHLPLAHYLESWGDTEAGDGSLCCVQPLIAPLNSGRSGGDDLAPPARGGRTALEVLVQLAQVPGADRKPVVSYTAAQKAAYHFVRLSFAQRSGKAITATDFEEAFNRYKQLGFLPVDHAPDGAKEKPKPSGELKAADVATAVAAAKPVPGPTKDSLEVTFHPSYTVGDGRGAMNPWLQELPDPITKVVWDNAACISPATAAEFGIRTGDLIEVRLQQNAVAVPAFVLPGQADYSIALTFGQYGQMRIENVPQGGGVNVFPLRLSKALHIATGAQLKPTGRTFDLVTTQEHGVIPHGRDIVREAVPQQTPAVHPLQETSPHADGGSAHHAQPLIGIPPDGHITEEMLKKGFQGAYGNPQPQPAPARQKQTRFPLDLARPEALNSQFQWGMVIDLNVCIGCSACMMACQVENNIPVVGKHEVKRNREMHWIRLDRYFTGPRDEPRIVTQPVACVHCEAAPCEQVCPVNAAVHSDEGLNLQVYNRCIGTRYCANACPYKVRRFNWFDFNKRGLDELRVPTPLAKDGANFRGTGVPETLKMLKNPDVSLRMRGVMEKCTYCVQRIERGKYSAKIAAAEVAQGRRVIEVDDSFQPANGSAGAYRKPKNPRAAGYDLDAQGRVIVPDGLIVTACEAACPTRAITFGNALDPTSRVSQLKQRDSDYLLLGELNTKPRTSYRPRLRNLNPQML
ncbi:MAG: TAT-variant-translocated molybdopterin oxidoreductase [Gemmataceae bacterium]|nr:TAT-variant-translocated molybdopterin oxidoreductase [Gemmata sp.]MDW8198681.1 TAT-variant-translocated molybdopterin oxidoreductase [Gemmataceae bacterium]